MKYNFDREINRENTDCVKYDLRKEVFGRQDVLPLWIADMDIAVPDFIINAVKKRAEHPVYGYSFFGNSYFDGFIKWMKKYHQLEIEKEWICFSPGIVAGINMMVLTYTKPNDKIIIQPPVYTPFFGAVKDHGRQLIENPLLLDGQHYKMDFDGLERLIDANTKMLILCNPHNPVGRSWKKEELQQLHEICKKNNVLVISDEIHCDLIRKPHKHTPMLSLEEKSISCFSTSKIFNIAGMTTSAIVIPNEELRKQYQRTIENLHVSTGNIFGTTAATAAYNYGSDWYEQLWEYLQENIDFVTHFCKENIPLISIVPSEATYLIWMDLRKISDSAEKLQRIFVDELKLGLNNGIEFGKSAEGFMRMNVACPRQTLVEAMNRLKGIAKYC